ncbi:MAG: HPt (histidine-containing phosphotransfer) domain-containing protein [Arenicella sp.]|jgi:HPt (histidine-containing phosphotransfer) domain-containing protein
MGNYSKSALLNQEYIKTLWEMDNGGTFTELVEISQEMIPIAIGELKYALRTQNKESLEMILHKLKGSAGTVGAEQMAKFVEETRLAAKQPNYDLSRDLEKLNALANQSLNALSRAVNGLFYL